MKFFRCNCQGTVPVFVIDCIHRDTAGAPLSAAELLDWLKKDAIAGYEEHPTRMRFALERIGKEQGRKMDDVLEEIREAHAAVKGTTRLPGEAINIAGRFN